MLHGTGVTFPVGSETMLLLVMVLSAIIGSCVYSLSAISAYLGARKFNKDWDGWYISRPFIASGLSLIFYFLLNGGLLNQGANLSNLNIVGVAGFSGLIGLFSQQAIKKLHDVADTLFDTAPKSNTSGSDPKPAPA